MNYRAWQLNPSAEQDAEALQAEGFGVLLSRVLAARGIHTPEAARHLLDGRDELSDPFLIKDMDKAVSRIQRAVEEGEPIVIFGDYDVDGVSATAILFECLSNQGAQVRCKLPSRDGGGYGLNKEILKGLADKGYTLVVTVDNGIAAVEEADYARELGIDLVITDHHLPGEKLPDAVAVVDPNRADDESPFKFLCGAGVAFKLCAALEGCDPAELLDMFGELAALGTIADVMPLTGENRTLVREGLAVLQETMRPGLQALLENAGYAGKPVTAETVSYGLAPRLNAAGRMDTAAVALKLLLCENEEQAAGIAARLGEINAERQQTEQQILAAALQTIQADPARAHDRVLVVAGEGWHPGVIGIVASRLMERYGRPAIVISTENGEGRGSGRAPSGFNLHGALAACSSCLIRSGGHAAAAGLLVEEEKIGAFRAAINAWAVREYPVPEPGTLKLDAAVRLGELDLASVRQLSRLAPFGSGNPVPLLLVQNAVVDGLWPLGSEGRHTRVRLRQGDSTCFVSVFGTSPQELPYQPGTAVDAAIEVSVFQGRSGPMVSAHCKAMRPAGLGNEPARQAAAFDAVCAGTVLPPDRAQAFLPDRNDTANLYRRIRAGGVCAEDLQPVFAASGAENTGKTLASLQALCELGLVEQQNGRWMPAAVTGKKNLDDAPILQKLRAMAAGQGE
ncbi:single-stranded-DNA-specific exonuclease RecJ [Gemmiger formicilis]|uniref:single-stranded-DNA-specific exonuclease RecJ n=1 Tax=Gemmiger formicilis TaxID=745368 RepID=UPI00195D38E7|nr:single-stranded-DNA-specific exonuclease RecJ [Gemmiger formicilis]MBM6715154.1 single-stranded-DNA-specific exonuclease RecJ [Gemmiger formicilis]